MDVGLTAMLQEALERTQVELEQALAENERLRAACKAALWFDAHDEDCATQNPRHRGVCDCERSDVKNKLKAALGA